MLKHFDNEALFYILVPVFDWLLLSTLYYVFKNIVIRAAVEHNFNIPFKFYLYRVLNILVMYFIMWYILQTEKTIHGQLSHMYKIILMFVLPSFAGLFSGITKASKLTKSEKEILIAKKQKSEKWNEKF